MKSLANIARSELSSTSVQFRRTAYGPTGLREFLRDVLAMANAPIEGNRYIVVGSDYDDSGRRIFEGVDPDDFKVNYEALANSHIEPPIRLRYQPVSVDGCPLGVYEIGDCQDRPYMMRIDHSETLRRGDAYVRASDRAIKMGRRQLQSLFEQKFRESVSSDSIEVGFPGEIIYKDQLVNVCSMAELPSAVAAAKLDELLRVKTQRTPHGSTTVLARLTHARLFGPDDPYEDRSCDDILREKQDVGLRYVDDDAHYLFERHGRPLQLVVYNQGSDTITDASLSIALPKREDFHVSRELPPVLQNDEFIRRTPAEQSAYPSVQTTDTVVQVSSKVGDIPPGEHVEVFESPLRICAGQSLTGRRFAIQYALHARNLRVPARGRLRLMFDAA